MNTPFAKAAFPALLLLAALAAQAAPFAYVTQAEGNVTIIDAASQEQRVLAVLSTGGRPEGVALNPDGRRAYVANVATDQIHVVDNAARAIVENISVPSGPSAVLLDPAGTRLYVLHPGTGTSSQLTVMSVASTGILGTIVFANRAERMELSSDGTRLWISHSQANFVSVVNTTNNTVVATVGTGTAPYGMAYDRNLDRLYVASSAVSQVTVIGGADHTALASLAIPGCQNPRNIAVNAPGTRLFVSCQDNDVMAVIDLASFAVTLVGVGARPTAIQVTPDGQLVHVVNSASGTVTILQEDVPSFVRGLINVGGTPSGFGRFIGGSTTLAPLTPDVLSGLWWNPGESGWGIHLSQRRNKVFAAWFTYDPGGTPRWYVASNCSMSPPLPCPTCVQNAFCSGEIFETIGPRFFRDAFDPGAVHRAAVGILQMQFHDAHTATMSYAIGNRTHTLPIQRMVFGAGLVRPAVDYTDLWWNPAESGWGLGITQQFGMMFLAWYVYDDAGRPTWYVASNCVVKPGGNGCTGDLYRASGPPGPLATGSFDASRVSVRVAGSIDVTFTDANTGVISYTVDLVPGSRSITRQIF